MPTGYTAPVQDGTITDVKDFAASCARAFGAFIHQRDDSMRDRLTYPPKPDNSYYNRALDNAIEADKDWRSLSEADKYLRWSNYYTQRKVEKHEALAKKAQHSARYESMLAQVESIDVPSKLQNFKDFMIEQLNSSIEADCGNPEWTESWYTPLEYGQWCDEQERKIARDLSYYAEELRKDNERYAERVEYINLMRDTFGFEVQDAE